MQLNIHFAEPKRIVTLLSMLKNWWSQIFTNCRSSQEEWTHAINLSRRIKSLHSMLLSQSTRPGKIGDLCSQFRSLISHAARLNRDGKRSKVHYFSAWWRNYILKRGQNEIFNFWRLDTFRKEHLPPHTEVETRMRDQFHEMQWYAWSPTPRHRDQNQRLFQVNLQKV